MRAYAIIDTRIEYAEEHPAYGMPEDPFECYYFEASSREDALRYLKQARTIPEYSDGAGVTIHFEAEAFFSHLPEDPDDR